MNKEGWRRLDWRRREGGREVRVGGVKGEMKEKEGKRRQDQREKPK